MGIDIAITAMEPEHYGVQVTEGDVTSSHRVHVPPELLDELGLGGADPDSVVRETVEFLLDREPATAIDPEVTLADLAERYPDFAVELAARLSGPGG